MPAAAAAIIRVLIQTAVQTGIWFGIDTLLLKPLKEAVQDNMVKNGMSEEEAKDHVANDLIDIFGMFGIVGVGIKSKLPNKIADYLGFTTKGYSKRIIQKKGLQSTAPVILPTPSTVKTTAAIAGTTAQAGSKLVLTGAQKAGVGIGFALGFVGVINNTWMNLLNTLDNATWQSSAYQGTFQKIISAVTFGLLQPDADWRVSKTTSEDVFGKVFNAFQFQGATFINDPFKGQTVPFTRDNMLDLIDKIGAQLLIDKGSASTKDVIKAAGVFITFGNNPEMRQATQTAKATASSTDATLPSFTGTKVFTGVVSQGVVGRGLAFVPRPDDMIESLAELQEAAANNLAPYLQSMLSRIVYEVKIVSSYIAKDGTVQRGTTQQVPNGKNRDGSTKFKTVTNRFATLNVFAISDKGVRTKLTTIVLGPTDSAKFVASTANLTAVEAKLPSLVTTSDVNEILGIETKNPITVLTPSDAVEKLTAPPRNSEGIPTNARKIDAEDDAPEGWNVERVKSGLYTWPNDAPQSLAEQQARTLSEWYAARGDRLPSVDDRATIYEALGLGMRSYYVGSAEQNTRLLDALKNKTVSDNMKKETTSKTTAGSSKAPTVGQTKGKVPTLKGKRVDIAKSKITEYPNGGAKIDGTMFSKADYTKFKEMRSQISRA